MLVVIEETKKMQKSRGATKKSRGAAKKITRRHEAHGKVWFLRKGNAEGEGEANTETHRRTKPYRFFLN